MNGHDHEIFLPDSSILHYMQICPKRCENQKFYFDKIHAVVVTMSKEKAKGKTEKAKSFQLQITQQQRLLGMYIPRR